MLKTLQFHKISPCIELGGTNNTPAQFENFIRLLLENGFTPVVPSSLKEEVTLKPIIVTFDDAYQSVYEFAFPIMKQYDIKALIFLITDYIGRSNIWDLGIWGTKSRHLNWREILQMKDFGIEFGSHTASHVDLTRVSQARLEHELGHSKEIIEKQIGEIDSVSFPFNRVNENVLMAARKAGYTYGFGGFSNNSFPMPVYKDAIYVTDNSRSFKVKISEHPALLYKYEKLKSRLINLFSMTTILLRHYD